MWRSWRKIFTCRHGGGGGGGAASDASDEDLAAPEKKASSDKHRWSFQKRLGRQRVLINTSTSDPLSVGSNKKSPENAVENLLSPRNSSIPKEARIEEPTLSLPTVHSELVDPPVTAVNSIITSHNVDDSVAVVIQAAIRGYFARRDLLKLKNVIKLQAALRGHLVRRQAIGTLRCIQAIIKMQTLVRFRLARQYVEGSAAKDDEDLQNDTERSTSLVKPSKTCHSMEKLLSNRFARQIMELTPKTCHIPIKCDPSRSDLAWKWFERWMTVAAPDKKQHQHQNYHQSYHEIEENTKLSADRIPKEVLVVSLSSDLELALGEPALQAEGDEVLQNSAVFEFQPVVPVSEDDSHTSAASHQDQSYNAAETLGLPSGDACHTERVNEIASESFSCQIPLQSIAIAEPVNPVFAAIQSKFEVLSSNNPAYEGALAEPESNGHGPLVDSFSKSKDFNSVEDILVQNSIQATTPERGTEVSISSALNSPDRSGAGNGIVLEVGSSANKNHELSDASANAPNIGNENLETEDFFVDSQVAEHERLVDSDGCLTNSILAADASQVDPQLEDLTTPAMQDQVEISVNPHVYMSSPDKSLFQKTVPESLETPASQVSVNAEMGLNDDNWPSRKPRLQLFSKSSPSTPENNFSARSGTGNMHKDSKPSKRRNSFGMSKSDHVDGERRISSDSFPSYMRATESTRAKIHACTSPKSGPDLQDRDRYLMKRQSFPLGNGKHGLSPGTQRSASQTQQTINASRSPHKHNASRSPHNIAERRWQR